MLNTFAWDLYVSLVKNSGVESSDDEDMPVNDDASCKNIIYYGPPGTGKTHTLQKLLREQYTDESIQPDNKAWLKLKLEELSWFEIIVLILFEANEPQKVTDIISHEYYEIKAELNERDANLRATAWAALQSHTVADSVTVKNTNRNEPLVFNKTEDSTWYLEKDQQEQLDEYRELTAILQAGPIQAETLKRFEFVTFHQSYGYEEFIEGLRPVTDSNGDISYEIRQGVFKRICKLAEADPDNQYAIVIDEINRGNISKIFGELITLIEVDKRAGSENELTVTLPYSGNTFCVPANLDVIGTMNTADRSLSHIDIALRRRFDFKELRTDYALVPENVDGINVRKMIYAMNQRIELLLDREHILGHALVMKVRTVAELKHVFESNILPLLEEYFFENWEKINQVLNNNGFVEEQKDASSTWLGESDDYAVGYFKINQTRLNATESYKAIYDGVNDSAFIFN